MTRKRAAKPARHHNVRTWSLYTSEGRLDIRVLVQLLSAWLLWLWQLLSNLRYVKSFVTSRRRLPYVIDEYGDVTYRPPKREWIRNLFSTEASIQRRLLNWIKSKIPDHRVVDLTSSWADGTALCALVEKLKPGTCPRHELLKPLQKIQNCKLALKLVQKYFNIPASVITPEEMAYCRDAKKMKQLLSLVRYFYHYPISGQLTPTSEIENCWAKGEGLRHGLVGKKAQFVVQTPMDDVIHLVVEIQGSIGEQGMEEITAAVPMRKVCKFFDGDSDGKRTEHLKGDESVMMDYQCVGEGRFVFNYLPRNGGHYTVSIRWHQDDIPGSPYTVRVDDVTSSLKEGYLPAPENVNAEGEWNYEQFGSTVIRRRSVVMETGRRLSALADQHEYRRKSSEDVRKSPELMKQRTVTRRRVIKRVMTLGGKEVTIDHDDENELAAMQRKVSLPKLGLFETVAMAIRENHTRSPSPAIESVADDLGSQVFEDAYSDFKSGHRIPSLKESAREKPSFFQQIRTDSNRESMDTADSSHKEEESNDSNVRSRNTSGGDSGIDLHNGKKLSSPSLEPLQSSRDSQSDEAVFYPVSTSSPRLQSLDTSSMDFETPPSSNFEISKISDIGPEPKRDVHEKFTVIQSPSMTKTCLYMTGKNVTGTMSTDNLLKADNQESDVMTQQILTLPETEENGIVPEINRGKLQTSRSLGNYGESEYSEVRKMGERSSSFSKQISPKRSASPLSHRPSSPFSPRKSFDMMVEAFQQEQNRQKVAQRASLTRQSELRSLQVDCRDFSVQVSSDAIKKEMARSRSSNIRVRRKRRKVIASDDFGSSVESMSTMSDFSFARRTSNVGLDSHDDVITMSTDDVTLPSMTSSVRRRSSTSTPSVSMMQGLSFERNSNGNTGFKFEKSLHEEIQVDPLSTHSSRSHASEKIPKSKTNSHSKIRKVRKSNFKDRLETSVMKWLRNLANAEESGPDFKILKPNRHSVEDRGNEKTTSSLRKGRHYFEPKTDDESASSGRTSAKTTPSDFSIPCECANYLANKEEYTRFFGELFESELCQDCVSQYKAEEKERLERQEKLKFEEMKSVSATTEKFGVENQWSLNQQNGQKAESDMKKRDESSAKTGKSLGFDSRNPSNRFTETEKFHFAKPPLPSYQPAVTQTPCSENPWSLNHPTEPVNYKTSRNPFEASYPLLHDDNQESPWPSTVFLDKRLLMGSRETSPKDLTDFVVRESWATLGEGPKPATGINIHSSTESAHVGFFKRRPDSEIRHEQYIERRDQRSLFSDNRKSTEKYELADEVRNPFQLTAQERRHYEYRPGSSPHLQETDEKQPHEKRWSPEHWQDITETSYLELPTRRRKSSSDEEGAKSMNFSVGSTLGARDILTPMTSRNFSPKPTSSFRSATNILNSHQFGSELPNFENRPKSSTSTLDSRKSGLSCQTCPSDTTSSLTQGQGQGQGRRFSDSASPNSPNTERRRNLMKEINQVLQQKPAKLAEFQDDDVIQQTSEINRIFSGMEFLKRDLNETENPDFRERNFGVAFGRDNAAPSYPSFNDAIPSTKTNGFREETSQEVRFSRAVTKRVPSPERRKNLSRSSSQSSIGRQFLDELEDLLKKHSEAKELGYGEVPQPGACQALGAGLSRGTVGQKNNFQVRTSGAGNGSLSLSIHGPVPHCVTETTVLYTGDSLYEVLYQVSRPGYYIISVKWSDVNIPNSPFICKVE